VSVAYLRRPASPTKCNSDYIEIKRDICHVFLEGICLHQAFTKYLRTIEAFLIQFDSFGSQWIREVLKVYLKLSHKKILIIASLLQLSLASHLALAQAPIDPSAELRRQQERQDVRAD
jgi:hypothetical protein